MLLLLLLLYTFFRFPCQDKYRLPREREVKCSHVSVNVGSAVAADDARFI